MWPRIYKCYCTFINVSLTFINVHCADFWHRWRPIQIYGVSSPQSLCRISCPLVTKRTNTLLTTFVVNVRRLFPSFSQPQHIDLERCAALSHTPALPEQLFIYRVASNAASESFYNSRVSGVPRYSSILSDSSVKTNLQPYDSVMELATCFTDI